MKKIGLMILAGVIAAVAVGCSTGASVRTPILDVGAGGSVGR